jgi:hypothetical protein
LKEKKIIVRGKRKEQVTVRTELRDKEERGTVLDGVLGLRRDRERIKILVSEAGVVLLLNPFLFFASLDIFPGRVFSFFAPFIDRWVGTSAILEKRVRVAKMGGRFCPTKMTWHNHGSIIVKYMIWPRTYSIFVFINRFKNYDNYDNFISIQIITWKYLNLTEVIRLINMFWSIKTDFKLKRLFLHCFYLCFKMYLV